MEAPVVYVEVRADKTVQEDERLLDDVCTVLDLAEQTLRAAGFELPLCTGSAVLGILATPRGADAERAPSGYAYRPPRPCPDS